MVVSSVPFLRAADPLEQWGQRTPPGTGYGLNAIAFGNGVFVAAGGNGATLVSPDGVNWTNSSPGNYGELQNVHFLNGEFNVVGNTNRLLRSSNGVDWVILTLPAGTYWDVAYGNGVYLVVGQIPLPETFASTDSVNWTPAAPRFIADIFQPPRAVKIDCIAFGAGQFVAMPRETAYPAERGIFRSTDGSNWVMNSGPHQFGNPASSPTSDMIYANDLFLIADAIQGSIQSSSNGVSWSGVSFGNSQSPPGGITYGAGYFVAVRKGGFLPTAFFSSTNATSWQQRFPEVGFPGPNFDPRGVTFGNDTFVVVGTSNSNPIIFQSGDLGGTPTILTEPVDRAAVVGNPASFSVVAGGSDPLHFEWQKDGSSIGGATNSTFTISNVVATNSGGYRVIVTNSFGSVTSRVAQLSVSFLQIHQYAGITILGIPGKTYRIEASPEAGGSWSVLTNLVLPHTPYIWVDYDSPNVATRVYRAAELQ